MLQRDEHLRNTIRLYEEDAYLAKCSAVVVRAQKCAENNDVYEIVLDQTVFFPEGGGQSADTGWILPEGGAAFDALRVHDVQIRGGEIIHFVDVKADEDAAAQAAVNDRDRITLPSAGDTVIAMIDWDRRFGFMQNHTGEHILSGVMHAKFGCDNVGFHLSDNTVTLDVNYHLTREQVMDIEWEANEAVYRNLPVQVTYPDDESLRDIPYRSKKEIEGQIRIVTIPGVDICACCAPHVRNTGEIGIIKIVRAMRWGDGTRLTIESGRRAFATLQGGQFVLEEISHLTNRSRSECADGVRRLLQENAAQKERIKELSYEAANLRLAAIPADAVNAYLFAEEMDAVVQRNLVNKLMEEHEGVCGVLIGNDECGYKYVIGSRTVDVRTVQAQLKEQCGARGGGKPVMVQGSAAACEARLRSILPA